MSTKLKPLRQLSVSLLTSTVVAATAIAANPLKSQALTFDFQFDRSPNSTVTAPIVGTGTFSFDGDPGDGTFALTSLSNYNFSFNFGATTFTNADITTPLANILAQISTVGSDRFVTFGGSRGGSLNGSLDFRNASGGLSFEPNFGTLYFNTSSGVGTYQAVAQVPTTSVPEPGSVLALLGVGLGALVAQKKKQSMTQV
ncbi:MAG: PEP-CTERM sorting domain-containing protein [Nostocales cyanobacterium]|nr:MAG: PEP-CTERM sorting domain-containing protein [Nostocales cyanobacterium]TAF15571.1 MAG: PEP-CTERM sorting domain-containing protein [Nostocales cyanobacterium]